MERRSPANCIILVSSLLLISLVLPAVVGAATLKWGRFSPAVISETATGTVELLCYPEGAFTKLVFNPTGTSTEIPLVNRGGGIYGVTLNAADLRSGLAADDVNRKFAGFLRAYSGASRSQYNMFIDVLTNDIPEPALITSLPASVKATPYLFNMIGNYDTPHATIAKKFYTYFGDDYDFLNIIHADSRFENRYHYAIGNAVRNIGLPLFDNAGLYGSAGRLKGISQFPLPGYFDLAEQGSVHELGHQWINFLDVEPFASSVPHWPISTLARDIMGFNIPGSSVGGEFNFIFTPAGPGQWKLTQDTSEKVFSDLSLYLMGLVPHTEVGSHLIFGNQSQTIAADAIWQGPTTSIDGNWIVSQMGLRNPAFPNTQRNFRTATILVTDGALASPEMMRIYNWFASRAAQTSRVPVHLGFSKEQSGPFSVATGGRGSLFPGVAQTATLPTLQRTTSTPPSAHPLGDPRFASARPIGVGPVASGGNTVELHFSLYDYAGPVDLYLLLYFPALSSEIYLLAQDGSLRSVKDGLHAWKTSVTGVDEFLFGKLPKSLFPSGTYYVALLAAPAGNTSLAAYDAWVSWFAIP